MTINNLIGTFDIFKRHYQSISIVAQERELRAFKSSPTVSQSGAKSKKTLSVLGALLDTVLKRIYVGMSIFFFVGTPDWGGSGHGYLLSAPAKVASTQCAGHAEC